MSLLRGPSGPSGPGGPSSPPASSGDGSILNPDLQMPESFPEVQMLSPRRKRKEKKRFEVFDETHQARSLSDAEGERKLWEAVSAGLLDRDDAYFTFYVDLSDPSIQVDPRTPIDILSVTSWTPILELTVDWGDGVVEQLYAGDSPSYFSHAYPGNGKYKVRIGPLHLLQYVRVLGFLDAHLRVDVGQLWKFYRAEAIGSWADIPLTSYHYYPTPTNVFFGTFDLPKYLRNLTFIGSKFEGASISLEDLPKTLMVFRVDDEIPEKKFEQWYEDEKFDVDYCNDLKVSGNLSDLPPAMFAFILSRCWADISGFVKDLPERLEKFQVRHVPGFQIRGSLDRLPSSLTIFEVQNTCSELTGSFTQLLSGGLEELTLGRVYDPETLGKDPRRITVRHDGRLPRSVTLRRLSLYEVDASSVVFDLSLIDSFQTFVFEGFQAHLAGPIIEFVRTGAEIVGDSSTAGVDPIYKLRFIGEDGATATIDFSTGFFAYLLDFSDSPNLNISLSFSDLALKAAGSTLPYRTLWKLSLRGCANASVSGNPLLLKTCEILDLSGVGSASLSFDLLSDSGSLPSVYWKRLDLRGCFTSSEQVDEFLRYLYAYSTRSILTDAIGWEEQGFLYVDLRDNPKPTGSMVADTKASAGKPIARALRSAKVPIYVVWNGMGADLDDVRGQEKLEWSTSEKIVLAYFPHLGVDDISVGLMDVNVGQVQFTHLPGDPEQGPDGAAVFRVGSMGALQLGIPQPIDPSELTFEFVTLGQVDTSSDEEYVDLGFTPDLNTLANMSEGTIEAAAPDYPVSVVIDSLGRSFLSYYYGFAANSGDWIGRIVHGDRYFLLVDGDLVWAGSFSNLMSHPYTWIGNPFKYSVSSIKSLGRVHLQDPFASLYKGTWFSKLVDEAAPTVGSSWTAVGEIQIDFVVGVTDEILEFWSDGTKGNRVVYTAASGDLDIQHNDGSSGWVSVTKFSGVVTSSPARVSLVATTPTSVGRVEVYVEGSLVGVVDRTVAEEGQQIVYDASSGGNLTNLVVRPMVDGPAFVLEPWPTSKAAEYFIPTDFFMEISIGATPTADANLLRIFPNTSTSSSGHIELRSTSAGELSVVVVYGGIDHTTLLTVAVSPGDTLSFYGKYFADSKSGEEVYLIAPVHLSADHSTYTEGSLLSSKSTPLPLLGTIPRLQTLSAPGGVLYSVVVYPVRLGDFGLAPIRLPNLSFVPGR